MKQLFSYLFSICIGLLILIMIEGIATLGAAFQFENYTWLGYTVQGLIIYTIVYISIKITDSQK